MSKTVVITGGASGIGAAAAARFAAKGYRLALCDLNGDELHTMPAMAELDDEKLIRRQVDVADAAALASFITEVGRRWNTVDILVNNAGAGLFGTIEEISPEAWRQLFAINVDSVLHATRTALPYLRVRGGSVVNIASISALAGDSSMVAYNASKAALLNMTRAMAIDHAADGIRINAVCPGLIATPLARPVLGDQRLLDAYTAAIPLRRPGQASEVAAAIDFLSSDDAAYITGTSLTIDGGLTAQTGQPNLRTLLIK